jgi:hypothetical protein
VSSYTRQLEWYEQIIEVFDEPAADERNRAIGSHMQFAEYLNQRCRHHDALWRRRDVEDGSVYVEQDRDPSDVNGARTSSPQRRP